MSARAQAHLGGPLLFPTLRGTAALTAQSGPAIAGDGCRLNEAKADFLLNPEKFELSSPDLHGLVESGSFVLRLDSQFGVDGRAVIAPGENNAFLQRCVESAAGGDASRQVTANVLPELQRARWQVSVSGALLPLSLSGEVALRSLRGVGKEEQVLQGRYGIDSTRVGISFFEPTLAAPAGIPPAQKPESPASGELEYQRGSGRLDIRKLTLRHYPAARLLSFVEWWLPAEQIAAASAVLTEKSEVTLDAGGQFQFQGGNPLVQGQVTAEARELSLRGVPVSLLRGQVQVQNGVTRLQGLRAETSAGTITGAASLKGEEIQEAFLEASKVQCEQLPGWGLVLPRLRAEAEGKVQLSGTVTDPAFDVATTVRSRLSGSAAEEAAQKSQIVLKGSGKNSTLKGDLFDGALQMVGSCAPGGKCQLSGKANGLALEAFLPVTAGVSGVVSGEFAYRADRNDLFRGDGSLSARSLTAALRDYRIGLSHPLRVDVARGKLSWTDVVLEIGGREVRVSGSVVPGASWDTHVGGSWDLGVLIGAAPSVEQVSGAVSADVSIDGPFSSPRLSGAATLHDGFVSAPLVDTIVGVSGIDAHVKFANDRIQLESLRAQVGDGQIEGSGELSSIFDVEQRRGHLDFWIRDAVFELARNFTASFDGDISVAIAGAALPEVRGEVLLTDGVYEDRISLSRVLRALADYIRGVDSPQNGRSSTRAGVRAGPSVTYNLALRANHSVLIDTNIAKAQLSAALRLVGDDQRPRLDGMIEVGDGEFSLRGLRFDVLSGRMMFSPYSASIDPRLEIVSESVVSGKVSENAIRMMIGGTLTKPQVSFSSDSGLSESEIVGLISGGTAWDKLTLLQTDERVSQRNWRQFLNPFSDVGLEERFSGLTGVTSLEIDSTQSLRFNDYVPVITLQRPLTSNLNLQLRSELGDQDASTLSLTYPLTAEVSAIAGVQNAPTIAQPSQNSNSFNGGFGYRLTFPGLALVPSDEPRQEEH